jgi:ketosteroid isomerase-like protein
MSQQNVEIVRRAFEAFNQGGIEEALPSFAPDIVVYALPEWPGPSEYRGHDGTRALATEWTENFDDFEMEVRDIRDLGDSVLVLGENPVRIKGTDVPMRQPFGALFGDFRSGQIGETRFFPTWRETLEAAGLS